MRSNFGAEIAVMLAWLRVVANSDKVLKQAVRALLYSTPTKRTLYLKHAIRVSYSMNASYAHDTIKILFVSDV